KSRRLFESSWLRLAVYTAFDLAYALPRSRAVRPVAKRCPSMLPQSLLRRVGRRSLLAGAAATVLSLGAVSAHAQDTLKLGLVAAMSGQSAKSGEAIVRGLSIAIDEIHAQGGVLGQELERV